MTTATGRPALTLVRGSAAVQDAAAAAAYRTYLDHGTACPLCPEHASQCATAHDLWAAYRKALR